MPLKVPADGEKYQQIVVQLQDAQNRITYTYNDIVVTLTSSNTAVGTIQQSITIPAFQNYVQANFTTTFSSGTTTITAAATNIASDQATLTTVGPIPTKLAVYGFPSQLAADNQQVGKVQVQLQDASGRPAKDPNGDIIVHLFASAPNSGTVDTSVTIPFGQTYATANFAATFEANATTITAQTSGYTTGQAQLTTYLIDPITLNLTTTADPASFKAGETTIIRTYVAYNDITPSTKATVTFASDKGGNFSNVVNEGNGYYSTTFTAPKVTQTTTLTITANATKTGYTSTTQNTPLTIEPNPTLFPTTTPRPTATTTPRITPTPATTPTSTPSTTTEPTTTPAATTAPTPTATPTQKPTTSPSSQPSPTQQQNTANAEPPIAAIIAVIVVAVVVAVLFVVPKTRNKIISIFKKEPATPLTQ